MDIVSELALPFAVALLDEVPERFGITFLCA